MYILPAMLICLLWAYLYAKYGHLPAVQPYISGIRPATTAIIANAVFKLSRGIFKHIHIAVISLVVLIGSLYGLNEVLLLFAAGILGALYVNRARLYTLVPLPLLFINNSSGKLFFIFLKMGPSYMVAVMFCLPILVMHLYNATISSPSSNLQMLFL